MDSSITDILNGNEPEAEVEAEVTAIEPTAEAEPVKAEQPRGADGKFLPKGETEDVPPASEQPVFEGKATLAERQKRQAIERELEQVKAQLQQLTNPPQPAPSIWDDEQGFATHLKGEVTQTAVQQASFNSLLNTSEMLCRDKYDDFEDAKAKFMELAEENPVLAQQALGDPHPWRKAYQIVKNHEKMESLGATDTQALEAKLREQIRAELEAEYKARPQVEIPNSLAGAQGVGGSSATFTGPTPLADLLR